MTLRPTPRQKSRIEVEVKTTTSSLQPHTPSRYGYRWLQQRKWRSCKNCQLSTPPTSWYCKPPAPGLPVWLLISTVGRFCWPSTIQPRNHRSIRRRGSNLRAQNQGRRRPCEGKSTVADHVVHLGIGESLSPMEAGERGWQLWLERHVPMAGLETWQSSCG